MLSVQHYKYKNTCLPLWYNSSFSRNKECIYEPFRRTVSFKKSFLPYAIKKWNKLDFEIRNAETYASFRKMLLSFIRPIGNSTYKIYDVLRIKLLTILRLGFSHLFQYKFRHNFADSLCYVPVFWKLSLHFIFFSTLPKLYYFTQSPYDWFKKILMMLLWLCIKVTYWMFYCTETRVLTTTWI